MIEQKRPKVDTKKVDTKEFDFPETLYVRDIENRVFQGIVLQCLSDIDGISLVEGNFIDKLLDRAPTENVKGITAEQDNKNQSVNIKIEINIAYGLSIPEKAEEIQAKVSDEITRLTGLHVSSVHVVFKNIIHPASARKGMIQPLTPVSAVETAEEEYNEEF
jgi:uncharacterized alkaline shock family protein YloU